MNTIQTAIVTATAGLVGSETVRRFCSKVPFVFTSTNKLYGNTPNRLPLVGPSRIGDHIWWISDVSKFASRYPGWQLPKTVRDILAEIHEYNLPKWKAEA